MTTILISTKKDGNDISRNSENPETVGITFTFVCGRVFSFPCENETIYNPYSGCDIPFQESLFSIIGYQLPFNDFEVCVLNPLLITHSQLHPIIRLVPGRIIYEKSACSILQRFKLCQWFLQALIK